MSPTPQEIARAWSRGRPAQEVGEFGLIAMLRRRPGIGPGDSALPALGIGDDAAILRPPAGWDLLLTCDIMIEGRHFRRDWLSPTEVGARVASVNLSDIAAMGGLPVAALASLGIPPATTLESVAAIYDGLEAVLGSHSARIIGGNVTAADRLILDLTLIGRVEEGAALRRSGAHEGDLVFVTGFPGRAAAALALLGTSETAWPQIAARCGLSGSELQTRVRGWLAEPRARITAGRHLVANRIATAAIDQSDGVVGDLGHICEESGVGIELEVAHLPVDPLLGRLADGSGCELLDWLLGASDDYELLFTAAADKSDHVFAMAAALELPIAPIGRVVRGRGVAIGGPGGGRIRPGGGWDHLKGMWGSQAS